MTRRSRLQLAASAMALGLTAAACTAPRPATLRSAAAVPQDIATLDGLSAIHSRRGERGLVLTLPDALFDAGKADLKADGRRELAVVAGYLHDHAAQKAIIEGHTDGAGSHELALRRGTAIETFLLRNGVDPERLEVRGVGAGRPLASNGSAAGRRENRRIEIVLPDPDGARTVRTEDRVIE